MPVLINHADNPDGGAIIAAEVNNVAPDTPIGILSHAKMWRLVRTINELLGKTPPDKTPLLLLFYDAGNTAELLAEIGEAPPVAPPPLFLRGPEPGNNNCYDYGFQIINGVSIAVLAMGGRRYEIKAVKAFNTYILTFPDLVHTKACARDYAPLVAMIVRYFLDNVNKKKERGGQALPAPTHTVLRILENVETTMDKALPRFTGAVCGNAKVTLDPPILTITVNWSGEIREIIKWDVEEGEETYEIIGEKPKLQFTITLTYEFIGDGFVIAGFRAIDATVNYHGRVYLHENIDPPRVCFGTWKPPEEVTLNDDLCEVARTVADKVIDLLSRPNMATAYHEGIGHILLSTGKVREKGDVSWRSD